MGSINKTYSRENVSNISLKAFPAKHFFDQALNAQENMAPRAVNGVKIFENKTSKSTNKISAKPHRLGFIERNAAGVFYGLNDMDIQLGKMLTSKDLGGLGEILIDSGKDRQKDMINLGYNPHSAGGKLSRKIGQSVGSIADGVIMGAAGIAMMNPPFFGPVVLTAARLMLGPAAIALGGVGTLTGVLETLGATLDFSKDRNKLKR